MYHDEPLFVSPITIDVGELAVEGYAYYDQKREQQDRQSFYKDCTTQLKLSGKSR